MEDKIRETFESITEHYEVPLRLSSHCEAKVYYRVEDLTEENIDLIAEFLRERISNVCQPVQPEILINLGKNFTGTAAALAKLLAPDGTELEVMSVDTIEAGNGAGRRLKNTPVILVNDVITTARSCLEVHTKATMMGAQVLCWAALIDRTFGPGPVPVVAAFTGAPIELLAELP